jgi:purine nucleosidase
MNEDYKEFSEVISEMPALHQNKRPIIIFCDPGIDDAIMLAHALTTPLFEILGIICCAGNTSVDKTVANALRICEIAGREDVKVFSGANQPFHATKGNRTTTLDGKHVYGPDGLGKLKLPLPKLQSQQGDAISFAVQNIINSKHPVTLISTGGLTDVYYTLEALSKIDTTHFKNIAAISMMGGVFDTTTHANAPLQAISRWAEFNIIYDADAAKRFFKLCADNNVNVFMAPLDLTHQVRFSSTEVKTLRKRSENRVISMVADLLTDVPECYLLRFGHDNPSQPAHDLNATMCLLHPDIYSGEWISIKCRDNSHEKPGLIVKKQTDQKGNVFCLKLRPQAIYRFFDHFCDDMAREHPIPSNTAAQNTMGKFHQ